MEEARHKRTILYDHLSEKGRVAEVRETENRFGFSGAGAREEWEVLLNGCEFFVWGDEDVLEIHSGDGSTALGMGVRPLNCTLKNV